MFQFCMLCSAGFHMFGCHSEKASRRWLAVDLGGILIGVIGCYLPAVHYAFYCLSVSNLNPHRVIIFPFLTLCKLMDSSIWFNIKRLGMVHCTMARGHRLKITDFGVVLSLNIVLLD